MAGNGFAEAPPGTPASALVTQDGAAIYKQFVRTRNEVRVSRHTR
jgi:hypothetical protein